MKNKVFLILILVFISAKFVIGAQVFYENFDSLNEIGSNSGVISGNIGIVNNECGNYANMTSNSYITYPITNFPLKNLTIEFWVKNINFDAKGYFDVNRLVGGSPNSMGIFYNGHVIIETRNNESGMTQVGSGLGYVGYKWNHIAIKFEYYNANCFTISNFLNGILGGNAYTCNFYVNRSGNMWVGRNNWYGYANSYVDEFKIYDYAKSNTEIYNDYSSGWNCYKNDISKKQCLMPFPESKGKVKINCTGLFVNNKKFTAKGLGYSDVPIGFDANVAGGDAVIYNTPDAYNRDFKLLREMHANSIRTWGEVKNISFLDAAWNNGNKPIYVIMGFWINCNENWGDEAIRQAYKDKFRAYVRQYKDHPAVLAWALGNENNLYYCSSYSYLPYFYTLANELGKIAADEEGQNKHPFGIVSGDIGYIGNKDYNADDASLPYVDFWASNVYRGKSFGSFFSEYPTLSGKPIMISEYGIDALNNFDKKEYEDNQSDWDLSLWKEINSSSAIGSTIMEYCDEWWKAGSAFSHDYGGYYTTSHPDSYSNEEWWGVVRTVKNGTSIDIMQPRKVYYDLKCAWLEGRKDGDVNSDSKIDIFDLAGVGICYNGKAEGSCANADVFTDGKIDIFDLATVGKNYGTSC